MTHRVRPRLAAAAVVALRLLSLCGLNPSPAAAAEPFVEKVDVFAAGTDGYAEYRIPGVVVTPKGTVLAYCEARRTGGDWAQIDVFLRRSADGGRTWDAPRQIAHRGPRVPRNPVVAARLPNSVDKQTVNNPVAIVDGRTGAVHVLYCVEYARCFYMRSDDDGVTFSDPVDVTSAFDGLKKDYDFKVLATGPGHGVQLRTGRLLVPVWLSLGTGAGGHRPSVTATVYSDDAGKTWRAGTIAVPETVNPNETVVAELADGRVMLNVRSESKAGRRLVATSPDGAGGWSAPRFDAALLEPICMASLARLSAKPAADKNRLVFVNPHAVNRDADGKEAPGKSAERKNLSVKLSYDEGDTWPVDKVLEPGPSAYSDTAVLPDGTILCFYERGIEGGPATREAKPATPDAKPATRKAAAAKAAKPNPYARLTLARFNVEWLTDGKDALR
jgi:sialidase-1